MLRDAEPVAFVPSSDLDRSRRFFGEVLGLTETDSSPFACVFRAGPVMLRVTRVDDLRPQPFTIFGWSVADLDARVGELTAAGVTPLRYPGMDQSPAGVWTAPGGARIAWFADPDGNVLSLTQFS